MASGEGGRANWKDPELYKLFIDLCLKESTENGKNGGSLKKESWDRVRVALNKEKNVNLSQKQLKNQWEYLKSKYGEWSKIISKTGNGYDPVTNTVNWSTEEWSEYIKANPNAKQFRYTGLQYANELKSLFAHDSRVLKETMSDPANNFPILPPGRYFLCDAAYSHTRGFMTPYRNVRYWLSDFRNGRRTMNKEERSNLAHARLRNVIERAFGVLKARFPILKRMSSYPFAAQRNIVIACITMHNYIRRTCISDIFLDDFNDPNAFYGNAQQHVDNLEAGGGSIQADQIFMLNLRDQIAVQLNDMNYY